MEQANPLGTERISSLLLKFSIPAMIGMSANGLYSIIDRIFIGNAPELGTGGLTGVTIGFPIMILLQATGILFGAGGATLFSMKLGEGKTEEAELILGNTFAMLLLGGALCLMLGQLFLSPLLHLFRASETALAHSAAYMRVIFFGAVFQVTALGMNGFLRADGQPGRAMFTLFFGAGANILLDALFINGFDMGMTGAALATVLSQFISMAWILSYFFGRRRSRRIRLRNMRPQGKAVRRIAALGLPGFLTQLGVSLYGAVLNICLLAHGGDLAVSGLGVVTGVQTVLLMPITGLDLGVRPIVSFNYGAGRMDRIRQTETLAIAAATVLALLGWMLAMLFPAPIISLFNREPELVRFGSRALRIWLLFLPAIGFQILGASFFQTVGRPYTAAVLALSRQVLLLIPAILVFSRLGGMAGLLYAAPFADALSALLTGIWFYFGIRRLTGADPQTQKAAKL